MKKLVITFLILLVGVSCKTEQENYLSSLQLLDMDGTPLQKKDLKDKVVILNLWATWCMPCVKEMPDLENMQSELSDEFELILATDDDPDRVKKFIESKSYDFTYVLLDKSIESLGVYTLPTTFIIGKDGELKDTLVGARKWDSKEQIEQLKTYLK